MLDPELLERITARRAELDELEEQLATQLAEVRAERDELAIAERVLERMTGQLAEERASAGPVPGQVGGRAVMLIPHREPGVEEDSLPWDYQRIITAVRQAAGPVMAREVGEVVGVDIMIALLAAQAPRLDRALKKIAKQGGEVVLIDGTLIRTQRRTGKADRRNYSGKHRSHGLHFLALTDENGRLIWISAARPGRTHDNTAARHDHILARLRDAGLGALADLGFRGLDNDVLDPVIVTGYAASRTHKLTPGEKEANRVLAVGRAPVEHGFAHLKNWRILTKLRTAPAHDQHGRPEDRSHQPFELRLQVDGGSLGGMDARHRGGLVTRGCLLVSTQTERQLCGRTPHPTLWARRARTLAYTMVAAAVTVATDARARMPISAGHCRSSSLRQILS
ncbi:transposase family protein [Streptomyces goshikiensis]|uniref:transposase family protein n=1 Tax=Streptomyces goshikiensis TaxID=1942 RepID=UPI00371323CF